MESGDTGSIVQLVTPDRQAIGDRTFIIEEDGRLYVAVAVLEYDAASARTEDQKRGVEEVRRMYEDAKGKCCLCAVTLMQAWSWKPVNTKPII